MVCGTTVAVRVVINPEEGLQRLLCYLLQLRKAPMMMTLLSRTASSFARRSARYMSAEAAVAPTKMTLNFCLPHETIYHGAQVAQVIIPGVDGEYGVTVNHVPTVAQLKPGVLQILHEEGETEKYFVAGGFALTHDNSVTVSGRCAW